MISDRNIKNYWFIFDMKIENIPNLNLYSELHGKQVNRFSKKK
jgi:hypothetical protein